MNVHKTIVAIDGATKKTGVAVYHNGQISATTVLAKSRAGMIKSVVEAISKLVDGRVPDTVLVEGYYIPHRLRKGLHLLIWFNGYLCAHLERTYGTFPEVVQPSVWKTRLGCHSKEMTEDRVYEVSKSLGIPVNNLSPDYSDTYDAIGIVLYYLTKEVKVPSLFPIGRRRAKPKKT